MENKEKPKSEGMLDPDFFNEAQFKMLQSGLIRSFKTKIKMHLPNGKKGLIEIKCTKVIAPGSISESVLGEMFPEVTFLDSFHNSLRRSFREFAKHVIISKMWYVYAEIDGPSNKKYLWISIVPDYFASYSFQRKPLYDPSTN